MLETYFVDVEYATCGLRLLHLVMALASDVQMDHWQRKTKAQNSPFRDHARRRIAGFPVDTASITNSTLFHPAVRWTSCVTPQAA